ncbi:hypothetical protein BDW66DRAFT_65636 [Aspergillus desertorum]
MASTKSNILVIGFGGIGTITAYNFEAGGLATVIGVLRSNYDLVAERGFKISVLRTMVKLKAGDLH